METISVHRLRRSAGSGNSAGKGFSGRFRKNRYVVLKGDQLYISEKEVGALAANYPVFS